MSRKIALFIIVGAAILFVALVLDRASAAPLVAVGSTFTVTNTQDQVSNPPSGSLRWAIDQANANSGADTINFNIGSGGKKSILLARELPKLTSPVTIDGTTQGQYNGAPLIELNGAGATQGVGEISGLTLGADANGSTIRGLVINSFRANGIEIIDGNNNLIEENYIGTDPDGADAFPNAKEGILIANEAGTASNNVIKNNLLSGNTGSGIHISGADATNNLIQTNKIGTNAAGDGDLGNDDYGVRFENTPNNTIGGTGANEGNIIAYNGLAGVILELRDGNTIRRNSIHDNGGLGIEISGFLNSSAPLISPVGTPPTTQATVTFTGDPNTQYTFEFFDNETCDPSDYGEGQTYFLTQSATSNGNGLVSFNVSLAGNFITVTATGGLGTAQNPMFTTKFSPCYTGSPYATRTPTSTATDIPTKEPTSVIATQTVTPPTPFTPTPTETMTTATPTACVGGRKPNRPSNVSPANNSTVFVRRVPLAWNESSCFKFFKVIVKEGSKTGPRVFKKSVTTLQLTTKELKKGKEYVWHVKACNAKGKKHCSKWSPFWKFKISSNAANIGGQNDWFAIADDMPNSAMLINDK